MKIYTKRGDQGQTDLMTKRVSKADLHISVNGAIDEAMAFILMAKHYISNPDFIYDLNLIHDHLFSICHEIALNDQSKYISDYPLVNWLEGRIDHLDSILAPLTKFIKLDQTKAASMINIARVTVRRAEREMVLLNDQQDLNIFTLSYLNRLSDYLFTLGRYLDEIKS